MDWLEPKVQGSGRSPEPKPEFPKIRRALRPNYPGLTSLVEQLEAGGVQRDALRQVHGSVVGT